MRIGIIDYGLGNLASVANALESLGVPYIVSRDVTALDKADKYIFPGVGAAGEGMRNLKKIGLDGFIIDQIKKRKPFLGICLGMQLLFEKSEEGNVDCLGVIKGKVKKLKTGLKIPQIGWNQITFLSSRTPSLPKGERSSKAYGTSSLDFSPSSRNDRSLFEGVSDTSYVYFVNSYICIPDDSSVITATTDYGQVFCSSLQKENVYGVQFHPEKSGEVGKKILKNFCAL